MAKFIGDMAFKLEDIIPLCEGNIEELEIEENSFFSKRHGCRMVYLHVYANGHISNGLHFSCEMKDL